MTYAEILSSIMEKRPEVVALTAESRKALGTIPEVFPDRFYDVGIAEMTGVGCAAGLSATGKIPFFHAGCSAWISMRAFESVRTTVAMHGFNVKFPGFLPGLSIPFQGSTHLALEDISLMRSIAGMTVMVAASQEELKHVVEHALSIHGCVYFRVPMELPEQLDYCEKPNSVTTPGVMCCGDNGIVFSYGSMVPSCIEACKALNLTLVNLIMLDPVPTEAVISLMKKHSKVATVEDHYITGGLGSIIAEVIADGGLNKQLRRIGVNDEFPDRNSYRKEILSYVGLDTKGIADKLSAFFS